MQSELQFFSKYAKLFLGSEKKHNVDRNSVK